ncbi:hypothetical protein SB775_19475 [Peribacillus sp. SIMBA_075]|uniref:hypothetical protein n=1 Tax=Peribacillus sp. SIMBA_075 TaxID=3085813 RepID=UPI00397D64A1
MSVSYWFTSEHGHSSLGLAFPVSYFSASSRLNSVVLPFPFTPFLYVRSPFESRKEEEDFITKEIERIAKAKNIDLNIYHAKEDTSKLGLKQNSLTLAFYQDGEKHSMLLLNY